MNPFLDASLGLNTKKILEAACDRHEGDVDMSDILSEEAYDEGSLARRISSGVLHSTRMLEDQKDVEKDDKILT